MTAKMTRQPSRVDARDCWDAFIDEQLFERRLRAPVGVPYRQIAGDYSREKGMPRLLVITRDAVVADMRVGKGHHLSGVTGVSNHFLVAAQRSVKDGLS